MGFIDKLRMNSIYGGGLIGNAIRPIRYEDDDELMAPLSTNKVQETLIAANLARAIARLNEPNKSKMDVVYQPSINERIAKPMTPYQRESLNLRDRSLDISEGRANSAEAIQRERLKIQQAGQSLREWKAQNPTGQIRGIKGGNYVIISPNGQTIDTGIPTGTLSREDEIELLQEGRLNILNTGHTNRLAEIGERGRITSGHIQERGAQARETKETAPGYNSDKPELPTQTRVRQRLLAQELRNRNPQLADFIEITPEGFSIKAPTPPGFFRGATGPTQEQYDMIINQIYGNTPTAARELPILPPREGVSPTNTINKIEGNRSILSGISGIEPRKIGEVKTFPNGNTARWDGQNWVLISSGGGR